MPHVYLDATRIWARHQYRIVSWASLPPRSSPMGCSVSTSVTASAAPPGRPCARTKFPRAAELLADACSGAGGRFWHLDNSCASQLLVRDVLRELIELPSGRRGDLVPGGLEGRLRQVG